MKFYRSFQNLAFWSLKFTSIKGAHLQPLAHHGNAPRLNWGTVSTQGRSFVAMMPRLTSKDTPRGPISCVHADRECSWARGGHCRCKRWDRWTFPECDARSCRSPRPRTSSPADGRPWSSGTLTWSGPASRRRVTWNPPPTGRSGDNPDGRRSDRRRHSAPTNNRNCSRFPNTTGSEGNNLKTFFTIPNRMQRARNERNGLKLEERAKTERNGLELREMG